MLRRIYSPDSEAERVFLESLLQARGIPYHMDSGGFGSVLPGLYVDGYTRKWVMVPEAWADEATAVIHEALPPKTTEQYEPVSWRRRLRILAEFLLFGWFVPGERKKKTNPEADDRESHQ